MLNKRLIPSLLFRNGRLVKGVQYRDHVDAGMPATTARAHNAQGADELMLLDIDASRERRGPNLDTVRTVAAECFMPLTIGGGIDSVECAHECLAAGADKVMVTTTALDEPGLIDDLAHAFGSQAVVVGLDLMGENGRYALYDHRSGSAGRSDWKDWCAEAVRRGAGEVRLMNVGREGTRSGPDLDLLKEARDAVSVPLIVEGGAGTLNDLSAMLASGADAVAAGALLVFADNNLVKLRRYLAGAGHRVRI